MTVWIIEPTDPLLARDGRPFGPTPGARARSLPFPFPSTTTGAARTRLGQDAAGHFPAGQAAVVQKVAVRGPLLVDLSADTPAYLAPAPRDALLFDAPGGVLSRRRLAPLADPPGAADDLDAPPVPDDNTPPPHPPAHPLPYLVGLPRHDPRKPAAQPPAFWHWPAFERWLLAPADDEVEPAALGLPPLPLDRRLHVGIDPDTLTGRDGALFMTAGLTFWHNADAEGRLSGARRLGLAIDVDEAGDAAVAAGLSLDAGYGPLGGERRLTYWRAEAAWPNEPEGLRARVAEARHCRVVLLTPAYFRDGWWPAALLRPRAGVAATLLAAAVGKPQTVSGWDLAARTLRPSRRLAPAGSVFYLRLSSAGDGDIDDAAVAAWLAETWFHCFSDPPDNPNDPDDSAAGFGLVAVGAWSGVAEQLIEEA